MQIALRTQVVVRFGDRHVHGRRFRLGGDAIVGIPGRLLEFRLLSVAAFRRRTLALAATTIAPSAPPSASPSPSLGLAAGLSRGFRSARAVSGLVPFASMAQVVTAGLWDEVRVMLRRKCAVVAALRMGDLAVLAATAAAPPASPLAALAAIGALVLSLILVGFALLGLPDRLRSGREALLGLGHVVRLEVVFVLLIVDRGGNGGRGLQRQRLCLLQAVDLLALLDDEGYLAFDRGIGIDHDDDAEALFEHAQMSALVVEEVERDLGARAHREIVRCALEQHLIERTQELQRDRRHRTHMAGAAAMRTFLGRTLQHARADALAGHFEQPEMRDVPDLDARAVVP